MSRSPAVNTPPDLRPQLDKTDSVDDEGRTYQAFSRNILTTADGQFDDGNVSLNVINMQYILSLGGLDARYISTAAATEIATNAANATINGNPDTAGQHAFMNLGNINGSNTDDITTNYTSIFTSDGFLQSIMFVSVGAFTNVIQRIADARSENGAEQSRLGMVNELLVQNQTNLEAAYGRIMDADMALESTRFARQNVLVQSSAAMVAQANQLTGIALTLLG